MAATFRCLDDPSTTNPNCPSFGQTFASGTAHSPTAVGAYGDPATAYFFGEQSGNFDCNKSPMPGFVAASIYLHSTICAGGTSRSNASGRNIPLVATLCT